MAVKIFGSFRSPYVLAVALAVYEKGEEFDLVSMDIKSPEYMNNYHPFGKIPAYQDEDITLFESKAILRYIANKYEGQGAPLLGSSFNEQAFCNQWLEVQSHHFTPSLMEMGRALMENPQQPDLDALIAAVGEFNKTLDVYEARLAESKYLAGDSYTLADLAHTPMFYVYLAMSDEERKKVVTGRPHLYAWIQDISSRPAWQKVLVRPENTFYGGPPANPQ